MNKAEQKGYEWLAQQGYAQKDIVFQRRLSPDFLTSDGKGWEVKLMRQNNIVFSTRQNVSLRQHGKVTVLVFDGEGRFIAAIPFGELPMPGYWQSIRVDVVDLSKLQRIEVYADGDFIRLLSAAAEKEGLSLSAWCKKLIVEELAKGEKPHVLGDR